MALSLTRSVLGAGKAKSKLCVETVAVGLRAKNTLADGQPGAVGRGSTAVNKTSATGQKLYSSRQQTQLKESNNGTSAKINPRDIVHSGVAQVYIPDMTLDQFIWNEADKWSHRTALECALTGRKYTYGQCRLMAKRFGIALQKLGRRPGEVVAVVLPNIPEFPIAFLGANSAGLAVTTLNPTYTPDEVARQLEDSEARTVITINLFVPLVKAAIARLKNVDSVVVIGEPEEGCHNFMDMVKADHVGPPGFDGLPGRSPQDICALPYSSGTTGAPKGVMLSHFNLVANISEGRVADWCNFHETTESFQETFGVVLPFFHIYSLNAIMFGCLAMGGRLVCLPRFEPSMYIQMLAQYRPTTLHTVPPLLNFVSTSPDIKDKYIERVHTVICGGAPAGKNLIQKVKERFQKQRPLFQEGYGLTETSPVVTMYKVTDSDSKHGSCGIPLPMTEVAVVDVETGESVGSNKTGEVYIRGPQVMVGYWKNEEATRDTMDGEWLKTGDIAYHDEDGNFYVVDRIKELIKVKGFQVAPSELEDVLRTNPDVADVAVFGVPDAESGELPKALIVPKPGAKLTADAVNDYMKDKVTTYKQLKGGIVFTDAIPRNPSGKILRKDLKTMKFE